MLICDFSVEQDLPFDLAASENIELRLVKELFDQASIGCSRLVTRSYSTSFSTAIRCLDKDIRDHIYAIYGFVRLADEIVDSFHLYDKTTLLYRFYEDTQKSIEDGISLNPILNSFQKTVNTFQIEQRLIDLFIESMKMDLNRKEYDPERFTSYVIGSAEVVGLMCLKVFCRNDQETYQRLAPNAMSLGSAFQKVNFLRDMRADFNYLGRSYFPGVDPLLFSEQAKERIIDDIERDFSHALPAVLELPGSARFGVYVAYQYYYALFTKIKKASAQELLASRIRISNGRKLLLLGWCLIKYQAIRFSAGSRAAVPVSTRLEKSSFEDSVIDPSGISRRFGS